MTYLMNSNGHVDTAENWAADGYTPENANLVEVIDVNGEWIEYDSLYKS